MMENEREGEEPDERRLLGVLDRETICELDTNRSDDGHDGYDDAVAPSPRTIGRFVVLRRIGRGAMGEVFSAFDEALGRRIAIKLLKKRPRARESRRARMRREAQAMAQVSHPNVIQVFEAGEHADRTFIAMEYVEGQTLERWQHGTVREPRAPEEILEAYLQAGAGLAAAHRAGVLHRDFKPSNVLVDADGRVRVMDFGLAAWLRRSDATVTDAICIDPALASADEQEPRLTRAGSLVGTPAFMSPEQFRGAPLDARCDQFAFCVALYEALVGMHPFGGETVAALRASILGGEVRQAPAGRALASPLRRTLVRGMAKEPSERFADMDALLEALRPRPRRARGPWLAAALGLLAVVSVSWAITAPKSGLCEGASESFDRVWSDERRRAARDGLLRTGVSLAEPTWRRVEEQLDAYGVEWAATRERVCQATHVRGEQSPELMDRRMSCLDLRLEAVSSLSSTLESASLETLLRAVDASARLPTPEGCEKSAGLEAENEQGSPEAIELRRRLVAALTHLEVGHLGEAHFELEEVREEARVHGLPLLAAEALVYRGRAEVVRGQPKEADDTLEAGLWEALALGHDEVALEAAVEHAQLVGMTLGDAERGRAGIARAEALLLRLGEPEGARLKYLMSSGAVLGRLGDYRDGRARLEEALVLAERLHGPRHVTYAAVLSSLGSVALMGQDFDEAERIFDEVVELDREIYDPGHTAVAAAINNVAVVMANKGDWPAARARFEEVLEVRRSALGEEHLLVGDSLMNLSGVMVQLGDPEGALPLLERARAIYAASSGEDAAKTNDADVARGMVLIDLDREAEAEATLRAVLARQRRSLGERHPDLTRVLGALGRLLIDPEHAVEGVALLGEAIEIQRERLLASGVPFAEDRELNNLEASLAEAQRVARGEP